MPLWWFMSIPYQQIIMHYPNVEYRQSIRCHIINKHHSDGSWGFNINIWSWIMGYHQVIMHQIYTFHVVNHTNHPRQNISLPLMSEYPEWVRHHSIWMMPGNIYISISLCIHRDHIAGISTTRGPASHQSCNMKVTSTTLWNHESMLPGGITNAIKNANGLTPISYQSYWTSSSHIQISNTVTS